MGCRVALIGFSAAGKTSVGRALAEKYCWKCLDLDKEIEQRVGRSVAEFIRVEGEKSFRDLEHDVLSQILRGDAKVVALGGGVLLREENRRLILQKTVPVFLAVSLARSVERVCADEMAAVKAGINVLRPLLAGETEKDIRENVERLMEARRGLYDLASIKIWTDWWQVEEVAEAVYHAVNWRDREPGVEKMVLLGGQMAGA